MTNYIIQKLNTNVKGNQVRLSVWGEWAGCNTIVETFNSVKTTLEYYKRMFNKRNKTVGEYLIIIDSKTRQLQGVGLLLDNEIILYNKYQITSFEDLDEFAQDMLDYSLRVGKFADME